jgi:hypothetical protein
MNRHLQAGTALAASAAILLIASPAWGQTTNNPFPDPIETEEGLVAGGRHRIRLHPGQRRIRRPG